MEPTVDATKHVNGGCRSLNSAGTEWHCYIGEEAVRQEIIGPGFLGEYAPRPAWDEARRPRLAGRMAAPDSADEILDVNRRYHDVAAADYDAKWGVDFGEVGRAQVLGKVEKLLGRDPGPFARSLEIGSGTGYFTLNLMQDGVVASAVCTDVSPGMLDSAARQRRPARARRRDRRVRRGGAPVRGRVVRPRARPRGPAPPARARPLVRASSCACCAPAACCCSPASRRATATGSPRCPSAPARRRAALAAAGARARGRTGTATGRPDDHALEGMVDVHAFTPADLERHTKAAGFADVRVRGEELLANWFGWFNRTLEASAVHEDIPHGWFRYAYRGYIALQKVDAAVLEPHLPAAGFYNLMLTARKPS